MVNFNVLVLYHVIWLVICEAFVSSVSTYEHATYNVRGVVDIIIRMVPVRS
jgi:hypothetical protein